MRPLTKVLETYTVSGAQVQDVNQYLLHPYTFQPGDLCVPKSTEFRRKQTFLGTYSPGYIKFRHNKFPIDIDIFLG